MFKNRMRVEPTPERVYALCRLVARSPIPKNRLREMLEPNWIEKDPNNFPLTYSAARELELISEVDERVRLNVSADVFNSFASYRRFTAQQALKDRESVFFRFTAWYLSQNDNYFYYTNVDELAIRLGRDFDNDKVDDIAIRGWRFWASFFGIGVLHNLFLIPNMFVRLHDALILDKDRENPFPRNVKVPFSMFVSWLKENCPESVHNLDSHDLCLGLSSGLRMLHDRDMVQLIYNPDSAEKWNLYPMFTHEITKDVTDILVKI
ncbi:Uncharacterized [Moorella glycerini]|uniref:Uncharacterized protein n=1 Tax=Neomoorella stamsii TaxID=1266720 RepID=A0A9X7J6F0_9FIRM|nr:MULTISPECIES: hypothetical protein [Moorella]PRR76751.1 hypothetical protein MOST_03950 [Moorella stamsii]CEP66715.1 Uncharacterized [Moorella glycerini]